MQVLLQVRNVVLEFITNKLVSIISPATNSFLWNTSLNERENSLFRFNVMFQLNNIL